MKPLVFRGQISQPAVTPPHISARQPPTSSSSPPLLTRYLPPLAEGSAQSWLEDQIPKGAWIIDPFGAAPRLVVEAARAGYRVVSSANNPVDRFLIELWSQPPTQAELKAALADLASAPKGDQRIEPLVRALYKTHCASCSQEVSAQAFIWERGETSEPPILSRRIYTCPACGDSGERPVASEDEAHLAQFHSPLHRARALERVALHDDPDRPFVEEALDTYLPRALYALFILLNKLDSLPSIHHKALVTMLLAAFDQANSLWVHPPARTRPRQLAKPARFREQNVWLALEEMVAAWPINEANRSPALPLTHWPELPPQAGGICMFPGRLRDLAEALEQRRVIAAETPMFQAALAGLPRYNQAYWSLSALWAGWLWGREIAAPFKSVLRRRRYDWAWHTNALQSAFASLNVLMPEGTPVFGLIGESEPGFSAAALLGARLAGFELEGLAMRNDRNQTQITWRATSHKLPGFREREGTSEDSSPAHLPMQELQATCQKAGIEALAMRGEPCSYQQLHAAILAAVVDTNLLGDLHNLTPAEIFVQVNGVLQQALSYRSGFVRYGGSSTSQEVGYWWLRESADDLPPQIPETGIPAQVGPSQTAAAAGLALADQVEIEIVRMLLKGETVGFEQIDHAIRNMFPGLLTPDLELVETIMASYAEPEPTNSGQWNLRPQDRSQARHQDIAALISVLQKLAEKLGFQARQTGENGRVVIWQSADGEAHYHFHLIASAVIDRLSLEPNNADLINKKISPRLKNILVYPAGRAALIAYKLNTNPRLRQWLEENWLLVKFRHIRRLANSPTLTAENLDEQLSQDPITNQDQQMALL